MNTLDIVIVGVGGQGTLLASRILSALAQNTNQDIKVSEVHGMAQRGGSVISYVRIGEAIHAPLIDAAGADYLLAFEQLEAVRALPYLKSGGTVIANTQRIAPMPVVTGKTPYPSGLVERLEKTAGRTIAFDALSLAQAAGEARAVNLVLLGAFARLTGIDRSAWDAAIAASIPARLLGANKAAFEAGYAAVAAQTP